MERLLPHAQISSSSRRRLARRLVGSPISAVERDLVLETLAHTHGNRTLAARLLGVSVRTLRNRIAEYCVEGRARTKQPVQLPPPEDASSPVVDFRTSSGAEDKGSAMPVALASMRPAAGSDLF